MVTDRILIADPDDFEDALMFFEEDGVRVDGTGEGAFGAMYIDIAVTDLRKAEAIMDEAAIDYELFRF